MEGITIFSKWSMVLSILEMAHEHAAVYRTNFALPIISDAVGKLDDATSLRQIKISIARFWRIYGDNNARVDYLSYVESWREQTHQEGIQTLYTTPSATV